MTKKKTLPIEKLFIPDPKVKEEINKRLAETEERYRKYNKGGISPLHGKKCSKFSG